MNTKDFMNFCLIWKSTAQMFNKEVADTSLKIIFNSLADYSLAEIERGIGKCLRESEFCPTIASVSKAIDSFRGEDNACLESKANAFYNEISNLNIGKDTICDDERGVFAFKRCFGSLARFNERPKESDPFDRQNFIRAYLNAKPEWYAGDVDKNLLKGIYHNSPMVDVRYIGDKRKCKEIAISYYTENRKENQKIRLERIETKCIENKQIEQKQFTKDEMEECKKSLDLVLKELGAMIEK